VARAVEYGRCAAGKHRLPRGLLLNAAFLGLVWRLERLSDEHTLTAKEADGATRRDGYYLSAIALRKNATHCPPLVSGIVIVKKSANLRTAGRAQSWQQTP
jgi:hypothetical protein